MKRLLLKSEETNTEISVLGITCSESILRLAWILNSEMGFQFVQTNDFSIVSENKDNFFTVFVEKSGLNGNLYLIQNKNENHFLIPKQNKCDFILLFWGINSFSHLSQTSKILKKIPQIQLAYEIKIDVKTGKLLNEIITICE